MDKEVARKTPANRVTERIPDLPRLPRTEVLERPLHEKAELMAQIRQMAHRGEISPMYRIRPTGRGWAVQVVRLREPVRRRWVKPALIVAGCLAAAGGVLWLLALALQALAAALAAFLPVALAVLGVAAALGFLALLSGGGGTTITQIVKIK